MNHIHYRLTLFLHYFFILHILLYNLLFCYFMHSSLYNDDELTLVLEDKTTSDLLDKEWSVEPDP